jgi:hypothetical protein
MIKKFNQFWRRNFSLGIQRAWKWLGVLGRIIGAAISLLVGLIIGQENIILISAITLSVVLVLYMLTILVFSIFIVPFQEHSKLERVVNNYKKKGKEPPEILRLAELRTNGVQLRNNGTRLTDPNNLAEWITRYTEWDKEVLKTLSKLSKGKSEWLRTLDKMPMNPARKVIDAEHLRYLSIFDEKLARLDMILRQYLNLQ